MEIGVAFPQVEIGTDPVAIRDFAQAVEEMGFRHISCVDHVLGARNPDPSVPWSSSYTRDRMFHEPLVLFGFLAAATAKVRLATAILILPQRQTALVAKQAAEVDVLTRGRLTLGMGIGWNEVEYVALNEKFQNRARRFEEQFEVLRKLWTEELVTFKGKYHTLQDVGINPLPVQRPIPLWIGAFEGVAVKRACRIAEGWFAKPWMLPDDEGKAVLDQVRGWLDQYDRDVSDFAIDAVTMAKRGGVNQWVADTEAWREIGVSHCTFRTIDASLETINDHIHACRTFAEAVGLSY